MKALFFDIDGTLFEPGKSGLSVAVIEAIKHVQSLGHLCFVASGRPYTTLPKFITCIDFDGYICGNGTQIATKEGLIQEKTLPVSSSEIMLQKIEELHLEYLILTTDKNCISFQHDELFEYYKQYNIDPETFRTEYTLEEILPSALKIETMSHTEDERKQLCKVAESLDFFVEIKSNGYMEFSDQTITKGTAMLTLLDYFEVSVEDSICFGDGMNDIDLFKTAHYRIAMGNAIDEIKALANEITLPVSEDGVAISLNKLFQ